MAQFFEERKDRLKRRDVSFSSLRGLCLEVGVTLIHSDEYVLVARTGLDGEATGEVRGSPVRAGEGKSIRDSVGGIVVVRLVSIEESLGASDGTKGSGWCVRWLCGWDGRCLGGGPLVVDRDI